MKKEHYKKRIIDLRATIAKEREAKKKDNAYYAGLIKRATTPSGKATFRKSKIDKAASHDKRIESLKRDIERTKVSMKNAK